MHENTGCALWRMEDDGSFLGEPHKPIRSVLRAFVPPALQPLPSLSGASRACCCTFAAKIRTWLAWRDPVPVSLVPRGPGMDSDFDFSGDQSATCAPRRTTTGAYKRKRSAADRAAILEARKQRNKESASRSRQKYAVFCACRRFGSFGIHVMCALLLRFAG